MSPLLTAWQGAGAAAKTLAPSDTPMCVLSQQVLSSLRDLGVTGGDRLSGGWEEAAGLGGRAGEEKAAQGARAELRSPRAASPSHPEGQGSAQRRMLREQELDARLACDQTQIWGR